MYSCPYIYVLTLILSKEITEETFIEKDQQQKNQILLAAGSVFQQHGYAKTSMDDIARQAGKSRTTVYKYYKNKDQVFDDYLISEIREIIRLAAETVSDSATLKSNLISYNSKKTEQMQSRLALYRKLVGRDVESTKHHTFFREQFTLAEKTIMKQMFQQGITNQEIAYIPEADLDFLISVITLALRGIEEEAFLSEEYTLLDQRLEWLIGMTVRGLK